MADLFVRQDVLKLFGRTTSNKSGPPKRTPGKSILMIGDSIMRCMYFDFIHLLNPDNKSSLCKVDSFRKASWHHSFRGERHTFQGDHLLNLGYGQRSGRDYREERDYYDPETDIQVTYVFITRCYSEYLVKFIDEYPIKFGSYPDLILMNSALWDINRQGPRGPKDYLDNMHSCMELFKSTLPHYTQFVWFTTPPLSCEIRGGFSLDHLQEFQQHSMRFNVMEGNQVTANAVAVAGFDVLDMHYHCRNITFRRAGDGIHWNPDAVRFQTNLWVTHYCLSNKLEHMLPGRWKDPSNGQDPNLYNNTELEEAMRLIAIADKDWQPLSDEDPGIKADLYDANRSYTVRERDENTQEIKKKSVERTFVKAKRRIPPRDQ